MNVGDGVDGGALVSPSRGLAMDSQLPVKMSFARYLAQSLSTTSLSRPLYCWIPTNLFMCSRARAHTHTHTHTHTHIARTREEHTNHRKSLFSFLQTIQSPNKCDKTRDRESESDRQKRWREKGRERGTERPREGERETERAKETQAVQTRYETLPLQ